MWPLLCFALIVFAEPPACQCVCDDESRRRLESEDRLHRRLDDMHEHTTRRLDAIRRELQTLPDYTEILGDISNTTTYITEGVVDIQNYLADVADTVVDSAVNTTNNIKESVEDFTQSVIDEVDATKENVISAANTAAWSFIYGVLGVIVVILLVAVARVAYARKWCKRKNG
jgi:CHASE3 domain sensor protein